jgi:hypothetical protein
MATRSGFTIFAVSLLAATVLVASAMPGTGLSRSAVAAEEEKAAPTQHPAQPRVAPQRSAPRVAAPQRAAPRVATPQRVQHVTAPRQNTPRVATQRRNSPSAIARPAATTRVARHPRAVPQAANPAGARARVASPAAARVVAPQGSRTVTASSLRGAPTRGAGRTVIRGQNYSAWRSGYRVRHGNSWETFVALSTLGAIAIGSSEYYPYAYISAPQDYCQGLTEDGCELNWQQVRTMEGDIVDQCVAYCPWR